MEVNVCIGSACHIKGSYNVIEVFKNYIIENSLQDQIVLKSAFCLGSCSEAVSVQYDYNKIHSVTPDSALEFIISLHEGSSL
ncbi:(2Fe-2S) ferredoxin domain-containing protein [Gudongella sp. DL1XJH-153]|uniref:(2Fe-2S) ferredoxin domain-containing protein n=1 Tax=Gudongella sp. DL1XJH-153 TaxID=3409804 RepID=UPI003BB72C24